MSGNHYTRQVAELQKLLNVKLTQLSLLESENQHLRQKEATLSACIGGIEGGLSATRTILETASSAGGAASPSDSGVSGGGGGACAAAPADAGGASRHEATSGAAPRPARSAVSSGSTGSATLAALDQSEAAVQAVLRQLGGSRGAHAELYSTWLLRRATITPGRAASHLAMDRAHRLGVLAAVVPKMAVLLPKYDRGAAAPATRVGSAREQLDFLVDDLTEKILVTGLWDPPQNRLQNLMVNLDTMQPEPYPDGWWLQVAQAINLTEQQRGALRITYEHVRAAKTRLTEKHQELAARLGGMQQKQRQQLHRFSALADTLPSALGVAGMEHQQQQQQALRLQQEQLVQLQQLNCRLQQQQEALKAQEAEQERLLQAERQRQLEEQQLQQQQHAALQLQLQQDEQHVSGSPVPLKIEQEEHELGLPLMSCGTLAEVAMSLLAQDASQGGQQQRPPQTQPQPPAPGGAGGLDGLDLPPLESVPTIKMEDLIGLQEELAIFAEEPVFAQRRRQQCEPPQARSATCGSGGAGLLPQLQSASFTFGQQQAWPAAAAAGGGGRFFSAGGAGPPGRGTLSFSGAQPSALDLLRARGGQQQLQPPVHPLPLQGQQQQLALHGSFTGTSRPVSDGSFAVPAAEGSFTVSASGSFTAPPGPSALQQQLLSQLQAAGVAVQPPPPQQQQQRQQQQAAAQSQAWWRSQQALQQAPPPPLAPLLPSSSRPPSQTPAAAGEGGDDGGCPTNALRHADTATQRELLLEVASHEQHELEQQMDKITRQIKLQMHTQLFNLVNILSKKQLAQFYVQSHPFFPDALSFCEAMDEAGW